MSRAPMPALGSADFLGKCSLGGYEEGFFHGRTTERLTESKPTRETRTQSTSCDASGEGQQTRCNRGWLHGGEAPPNDLGYTLSRI